MAKTPLHWRLHLLLGKLQYGLKIEGKEYIPETGPCVLAFNHTAGYVTGLVVALIYKRRPDVVMFGAVGLPPGGRFGKWLVQESKKQDKPAAFLGAYRAKGLSAMELVKAIDLLKKGGAMALAAEGELSWNGKLIYPLAPGSAWMAMRAHVPVIPIVSVGGYDIHPRWAINPKLTGKVTIRVGEPFYLNDAPETRLTDALISAGSDQIYAKMKALIEQ